MVDAPRPIMPKAQKTSSTGTRKRGRHAAQTQKQRGTGIQKPVKPDDALAEVVGARAQPRTQLIKRIWDYIKSHDLQDPKDRRVIRPDQTLGRVLPGKRVSMFDIARLMNAHVRA
jgi:upstream activation factor subunit UAF30